MKLQFLGRFSETDGNRSDLSLRIFLQYRMFQNNIWVWDKYRGSRQSLSLSPLPLPTPCLAPARWKGKQPDHKWSGVPASNSFQTQESWRMSRQLQWPRGLLLSLLRTGRPEPSVSVWVETPSGGLRLPGGASTVSVEA